MRRLNGGPPVQGTNPVASTRPLVGYKSPASILSVVVLPAPFGPRNATISPGSIRNVTSRTACTSRYRGRKSARRAPRSPGSRTFTWNVLLTCSAVTMDDMGVENLRRQDRFSGVLTTIRLMADRRHGVDRRAVPRRLAVAGVSRERRSVVDRRHGAERGAGRSLGRNRRRRGPPAAGALAPTRRRPRATRSRAASVGPQRLHRAGVATPGSRRRAHAGALAVVPRQRDRERRLARVRRGATALREARLPPDERDAVRRRPMRLAGAVSRIRPTRGSRRRARRARARGYGRAGPAPPGRPPA